MPYFKVKEESGTKKLVDYSMPPVLDASEVGYDSGNVESELDKINADLSAKQPKTMSQTIAGQTTVEGCLSTLNSNLSDIGTHINFTSTSDSGTTYTGQKSIATATLDKGRYLIISSMMITNTSGSSLLADISGSFSSVQMVKYSIPNSTELIVQFIGLAVISNDNTSVSINVGATGNMTVTNRTTMAVILQ